MHLRRFADALPYQAAGHEGMRCLRLQGMDAGPMDNFWMAASVIEPGGRILPGASPLEKAYVVLEGEVTISGAEGPMILSLWDSCRIAPHETRAVHNHAEDRAVLMLVMATPPST